MEKIEPITLRLPAGFTARPVEFSDAPAVSDLLNTYAFPFTQARDIDAEELENGWKEVGFDLQEFTRVVFAPDGALIAYAEIWDIQPPYTRKHIDVVVLPEYQQTGVVSGIFDWVEAMAQARVDLCPEGARVTVGHGTYSNDTALQTMLTARDFEVVRTFYQMRIDFTEPPAPGQFPEGVRCAGIHLETDLPEAVRSMLAAFQDHWGFTPMPLDEAVKRWRNRIENDAHFDPGVILLAWEGDHVVGVSFCTTHVAEDPNRGWVNTLGVERPWRKRGLGLALLQQSFYELAKRGRASVGLGVDATSLTGATRLYERAGMRVARSFYTLEKELRAGAELSTQNLEE